MSRTIAIAAAAALGAALLASLAYGHPVTAGHDTTAVACATGSVSARIAGKHRCLRAGQQCRRRYDRQFHRYGFHCHFGRLTRKYPSAGKVVAAIRLDTSPMGMVSASGSIWVTEHNAGTVARIDPGTNTVTARVPISSGQPGRLAAGPEGLWHLPYSDNTLQELDPATNSVSATVAAIGAPDDNCCQPAVGAGSIWVPKGGDGIYRVDATSHAIVAHVPIENFYGAVFAAGSLWVISGGDVLRLDPATNSIVARIAVPGLDKVSIDPGCCPALAVGPGAVWIGLGKKIARIDPTTNAVAALIHIPGSADFLAATDTDLWAVGADADSITTLWRIDPVARTVTGALGLSPNEDGDLVAASGSLWITLMRDRMLLRVQPAGTAG